MRFKISDLNFFYGPKQAVFGLNLKIPEEPRHRAHRPFRLRQVHFPAHPESHERHHSATPASSAQILLDGQDILKMDVVGFAAASAWSFSAPILFRNRFTTTSPTACASTDITGRLDDLVEHSLRRAALWEEVKDYLHKSAFALSGGQQQRLCIARALAVDPEVLLLDEPCSALDPVTTAKIEELMFQLKDSCTMAIVTHNMQQAARASDFTAFMLDGKLIEHNETSKLFTTPSDPRTEAYITGRFG